VRIHKSVYPHKISCNAVICIFLAIWCIFVDFRGALPTTKREIRALILPHPLNFFHTSRTLTPKRTENMCDEIRPQILNKHILNQTNSPHYTENLSDQSCSTSGLRFAGELSEWGRGAGLGTHLPSVADVIGAGGGPPIHPGWAVTLKEKRMGRGLSLSPQTSKMCVSTEIEGLEERYTLPWMGTEKKKVGETGMGEWDQLLREFEGSKGEVQGAVGGDMREAAVKGATEQDRLYTGLKYNCGSVEERAVECAHDNLCSPPLSPLSLSLPPPLLEVEEDGECGEDVGGAGSDCDDLSWLVGAGNM